MLQINFPVFHVIATSRSKHLCVHIETFSSVPCPCYMGRTMLYCYMGLRSHRLSLLSPPWLVAANDATGFISNCLLLLFVCCLLFIVCFSRLLLLFIFSVCVLYFNCIYSQFLYATCFFFLYFMFAVALVFSSLIVWKAITMATLWPDYISKSLHGFKNLDNRKVLKNNETWGWLFWKALLSESTFFCRSAVSVSCPWEE